MYRNAAVADPNAVVLLDRGARRVLDLPYHVFREGVGTGHDSPMNEETRPKECMICHEVPVLVECFLRLTSCPKQYQSFPIVGKASCDCFVSLKHVLGMAILKIY
jgi:hypothetical protein